ncbi:AraC family transcriptional regulator [Paenibacillus sp. IB182496]|uniref:AraC family transcriptional regulator n=1 Tax=Paenibacillus sabuli TaxID=2772509 RepID=A0A927BQ62_9BACL|nr:helix-turn-helix domain-containing protein [Paenibacillus sabuli]MBD2843655.1 AraC family transcriptional regulator [Paenibacillus sabuli]
MRRLRMITVVLVLSILPVVGFGAFVYVMGTDVVKSEIHRSSLTAMNQMSRQMDATLSQIEQFTTQLAMQVNLIEIAKIGAQPRLGTLQATNQLKSELNAFAGTINGIDTVDFYHFEQELVVSSRGLFSLSNGQYADLSWMPQVERAEQAGVQSLWMAPRMAVSPQETPYPVITHARLLPLLSSKARAVLLVNLKPSYLHRLIGPLPEQTDGAILVLGERQETIVQQGNLQLTEAQRRQVAEIIRAEDDGAVSSAARWDQTTYRLHEPELYVTLKKSDGHEWVYAMIVPVDSASQSLALLRRIIVTSTLGLSLLALVTAYFSFARFQRGIQRLLRLFEPERVALRREARLTAPSDHYAGQVEYIAANIASLMNEVREVRASWRDQLPLLRAHYLLSAIVGNASSTAHLTERYQKEIELFGEPLFAVLVVEMVAGGADARFSDEDLPLFLFAAANIINELLEARCRVETVVTHDHVVVIFNLKRISADAYVLEAAEQIRAEVRRYTRHSVTIGVGRCVASFDQLSLSYHEALRELRLNWLELGDVVLSDTTQRGRAHPLAAYPSQAEGALLECVRSGDEAGAGTALTRFHEELAQRRLPFSMIKTYDLQLLAALLRLAQEYEADLAPVFGGTNPYDAFFRLASVSEMDAWFTEAAILPIMALIRSSRKQRKEEVARKALRIVEERYAQDLSLQLVAEELRMTPSYVSLIFKQETGGTFIQHVTRFRVERAKRLLRETELTIAQVAGEVGYANAQHLIRVFKKLEQCTPGEYRARASA